nr:hypothetical protein GCM10017611_67870 [Rhodococcus wratislaviensis]
MGACTQGQAAACTSDLEVARTPDPEVVCTRVRTEGVTSDPVAVHTLGRSASPPAGRAGVHIHHPTVLPHLEHQGVGGDERVRSGVQGSAAERLDLGVEVLGHHGHLRLGSPKH